MLTLPLDDNRWSELVARAPKATLFHHPAWAGLLSEAYGYPAYALALPGRDGLAAGLPVLEIARPLRRRRLVSLPFTDACGPIVQPGEDVDIAASLTAAHGRGEIPDLELRSNISAEGAAHASLAVIHRLALEPNPQQMFRRFRKSQVQRGIARAEREGVIVRKAGAARDLTDVFYGLHVSTRRRLGVPVQPRRYFRLLWERIIEPELGFLLLAFARGRAVAGAVFLAWNGTVIYKYGASDRDALSLRPNHALFWHAIRCAAEDGSHTFDFGRSDTWNTGLRSFKSDWGATEEELVYTYLGRTPANRSRARGLLEPVIRRSPDWVCRYTGELLYRYAA